MNHLRTFYRFSSIGKCTYFPNNAVGICKLIRSVKTVSRIHSSVSVKNKYPNLHIHLRGTQQLFDSSDIESFKESFEVIYNSLMQGKNKLPAEVSKRLENVLRYNILGGKNLRGYIVLAAFKELRERKSSLESADKTPEDLKLALILGWCVELLQGFFVVADDIMDNGLLRRGKDCWFRLPDVGLQGVNDALLLESCIYDLLRKHFSDKECYQKLVEEFLIITRDTIWGQCLDMASNPFGQKPQLELFKLKHYWQIVELKTAKYTFCLPVFLAMHLIGNFCPEDFKVVENLCIKFGRLFQVQDDFLDLYGKQDETGKIGTDISEGKCTWFAATVLENAKGSERNIMEENYGVKDSSATEKVLQLYESLSLKEKYIDAENQLQSEIAILIAELDVKKKNLFLKMLEYLYARSK